MVRASCGALSLRRVVVVVLVVLLVVLVVAVALFSRGHSFLRTIAFLCLRAAVDTL